MDSIFSPNKQTSNNKNDGNQGKLQIEFRYKPRTDLERIFDEINKNSFRKLDKRILDNHMREIQSRKSHRSTDSFHKMNKNYNNKDDNRSFDNEGSFFNENHNEIDEYLNDLRLKKEEEKKKMSNDKIKKLYNRNKDLNQESKKILDELHHKTHFKAVSTIANHYKERGNFFILKIDE